MDGGGCRLNSGSGSEGQGSGLQHGRITLSDLESFSEDQLPVSGTEGSEEIEMMEDEEQNRLLSYWQEVAREHRIGVPRDMAEPIQQMTTNNNDTNQRETVPFTLVSRKEKCGELLYEKRYYDKVQWACITIKEDTYEQSSGYGFMKIMKYICQQNSLGIYLGMTIPILTVVQKEEANSFSRAITVAYYLPSIHQAQPPQPLDPDIVIEEWPATTVYSRSFIGTTNETTLLTQINELAEILDSAPGLYVSDSFIVASYTHPADAHRVNEIWFIQR